MNKNINSDQAAIFPVLLFAFVTFRYGLKGPYFALSTIAFAQAVLFIVLNTLILGGASGVSVPLKEIGLLNFQFISKMPYYYIILSMLGGLLVFKHIIERKRLGFYFRAIKVDEVLAQYEV